MDNQFQGILDGKPARTGCTFLFGSKQDRTKREGGEGGGGEEKNESEIIRINRGRLQMDIVVFIFSVGTRSTLRRICRHVMQMKKLRVSPF